MKTGLTMSVISSCCSLQTQTGSSESAAHAQFSVSLLAQIKEEPASFVVQVFPPELNSALHETAAQTGAVQRGSGKLAHLYDSD